MFGCYSNGEGKPTESFKQLSEKGFTNPFKQDFVFCFTMKIEAAIGNFALTPASLSTQLLLC